MKKLRWYYQIIFSVVFSLCTAGMLYGWLFADSIFPEPFGVIIAYILLGLVSLCMFSATEISLVSGLFVALSGPIALIFFEYYTINFAIILGVANCLMILSYWLFKKKQLLGILVGSVVRTGFVYLITQQAIPVLFGPESEFAGTVIGYWDWTYLLVPLIAGLVYIIISRLMERGSKNVKTVEQDTGIEITADECDK